MGGLSGVWNGYGFCSCSCATVLVVLVCGCSYGIGKALVPVPLIALPVAFSAPVVEKLSLCSFLLL